MGKNLIAFVAGTNHADSMVSDFCCGRIKDVLSRSEKKEEEARSMCASEEEFLMLKRAFWNKAENLGTGRGH